MKVPRLSYALISRALALFCMAAFVYLLLRMDLTRIWFAVLKLKWTDWMLLMGLRFLFWGIRSLNWCWIMRYYGSRLSLRQAFAARLAGHAVGYLTPVSKLGGEAARIFVVDGINRPVLFASTVVDKSIEFLATLLLIAFSVVILISNFTLSGSQKTVVLGGLAAAALIPLLFIFIQKRGLFTRIFEILSRLRLRFSIIDRKRGAIEETDTLISKFYQKDNRVLPGVFLMYLIWAQIWVLEIYLSFLFLGTADISWLQCYLLVTLGSLAYLVPALPAALGTYELTYMSLFALLVIDLEAGIAVILIRRVLGLVWAGLGVFFLFLKRGRITKTDLPDSSTG